MQENLRQLVRPRRAFAELRRNRIALAPIAKALLYFVFKPRRQPGQHVRHVRAQVVGIKVLAPEVTGIHEVEHRGQNLDDALARGQIAMRDAPAALIAQVAAKQLASEVGKRAGLRHCFRLGVHAGLACIGVALGDGLHFFDFLEQALE